MIFLSTHDLSTIAEFKLPSTIGHAHASWKSDNQAVAVVARDAETARIIAYTLDRSLENVRPFDLDNRTIDPDQNLHSMAVVCAWEPRQGAPIAVSGPQNKVTFFEPNGQRHKRNDFNVLANEMPPKILRWIPGNHQNQQRRMLAVVTEEHEDQLQGDGWRLSLYTELNYKWLCKKRMSF